MAIKANYPAILPSLSLDFANTKQLDPRITFTRTTTATYYDGKTVAKAEENLLLRSQEFENASWSQNVGVASVTANSTVAPDGTTTADTITSDGSSFAQKRAQGFTATASTIYTFSVYFKKTTSAASFPGISLSLTGAISKSATINTDTGVVTKRTGEEPDTVTSTPVGDYWRVTLTHTTTSSPSNNFVTIYPAVNTDGSGTWAVTAGSCIIWGAQLEQRSSVTAYTPTTTQPITNYIPQLLTASAGRARFDFNPITGESLGLLIEEARTNLLTYSEQFDDGSWSKVNSATVLANQSIAPDGTLTADKLNRASTATNFRIQTLFSATSSTSYTLSVYAKAGQISWFSLNFAGTFPVNSFAFFNLSNGTLGSVGSGATASIVFVGNGWYRCSITSTANSTGTGGAQLRLAVSDGTVDFSAGSAFDGVYLWGAQLEAGSFATSYIPTVAASVTRNADAASMTGTNFSSWYRADEGTVLTIANAPQSSGRICSFSFGTSETPRIDFVKTTATNFQVRNRSDSGVNTDLNFTVSSGFKNAYAYKTNDISGSVNGTSVATNTSIVLPLNINQLAIGQYVNLTSGQLNGTINKLAYYPKRLTDAQLQALTA